jgi:hypothetical protein
MTENARRARPSENRIQPLSRWLALATIVLGACQSAGLPPGFAEAAATGPEDTPARLWLRGDRVVAAAAGMGQGALPQPAKAAMDAVAPGGELVFLGREWGPRGERFRVEKRYVDGSGAETYRSALVTTEGEVIERSHSIAVGKVPPVVLGEAMKLGRDLRRCDIVSDAITEREWRIHCVDGGGRTFVVVVDMDGSLIAANRVVTATLQVDAR